MKNDESIYYVYGKNFYNEFDRIGIIEVKKLPDWLNSDGKEHAHLKLVKENGHYVEIVALPNEWDVVDRGIENISFHESRSFNRFSRESSIDKKVKRANKDKPQDQRKHHMKASRGINRKDANYIPKYRQQAHQTTLPTADNVLKNAKAASSGAWKLSKRQVVEIAAKYKFNIPTETKHSKHLGSTGIVMWRKSPKDYYLVKFSKHMPSHTKRRRRK